MLTETMTGTSPSLRSCSRRCAWSKNMLTTWPKLGSVILIAFLLVEPASNLILHLGGQHDLAELLLAKRAGAPLQQRRPIRGVDHQLLCHGLPLLHVRTTEDVIRLTEIGVKQPPPPPPAPACALG